ncbi:hypothetical protein BCR36DRAFT_414798 [Piromyces finnis]|uniref:DUF4105 domain-containing protein n=1 Tax=Piromyces finnis TaxID=1754191 RepID=A0A1Y1V179_9FUNG|nr:hypothetical protein BCR36DRAFT_414798 [Piromyces finnis]|eukprot:ORX44826.1 hypothetical protein BCR36DRAFT_414798 [Piromyces finnis]
MSQLKKKKNYHTDKNEKIDENDFIDYSSESSISYNESMEHLESLKYAHSNYLYHSSSSKRKNKKNKTNSNARKYIKAFPTTPNLKNKKWTKKNEYQNDKNDIITIKISKSNKFIKNLANSFKTKFFLSDTNSKIQNHKKRDYLLPDIKFSKQNNLTNILKEEILKEINYFIQQNYTRPNEQLNSAINISKAIEFFLVKNVPFSILDINFANKSFLLLLERIGNAISNKYYSIQIGMKQFDLSFFTLCLKLKNKKLEIENKRIIKNRLDLLVAMELIQHFKKYPFLNNVQCSIKDPILTIASPYAKLIANSITKDIHKELSRHITANKNAIPYKILEIYPDFEEFLNKNFIHRYLYLYHHSITVDLSNKPEKILIMYKGKMENWTDIKDKIVFKEDGVTLEGKYSQEGIIDEGVYNWTELKPFMHRSSSNVTKNLTSSNSKDTFNHDKKENTPLSINVDNINVNNINLQSISPHSTKCSDEDDDNTLTNDFINFDDSTELKMIYKSLYNNIDYYSSKYKLFSRIYKEGINQDIYEAAEKFIYYDIHFNNQKDPYEHTWGSHYLFEYCSWITSRPRFSGDHAWIRLKTPDGNVYSVGLYREEKRHIYDQFVFPMRMKSCKYMSPDVSEFWKGYYSTISVEITKEQFEKIKAKIEEYQRLAEYHPYQLLNANCASWASDIASIVDIHFPNDLPLSKILFNNVKVQNIGKKIFETKLMAPHFIFFNKALAFIINTINLIFGAGMIDKKLKNKEQSKIEPFIKNIKDMFDPNKIIIIHPFIIGYHVRNYIITWRLDQIFKLEKKLKEIVENLKETKHQYLLQRKESLHKGISLKDFNNDNSTNAIKIRHYQDEIKSIYQKIENIRYSIPNKFRKKHIIPEGDLYTQYPLND